MPETSEKQTSRASQIAAARSRQLLSNSCKVSIFLFSIVHATDSTRLTDLGAWRHVDHSRIQAYTRMNVWDGITGSRLTFDWLNTEGLPFLTDNASDPRRAVSPNNANTIAYMTENNNLTQALLSRLAEEDMSGLQTFSPARVEDIQLGSDGESGDYSSWPVIRLSTGQTITSRLLVGADGPNSIVRTFAGINSKGWDYERHGVVATLRLSNESGHQVQPTAYQRFLPTGPCALLPMPNGFASLVWSTTPERAALLKSLAAEDFLAMVNAAFRLSSVDIDYMHTLSAGQAAELDWRTRHTPVESGLVPQPVASVQPGSIASFPLRMRHADAYTGERIALAGDAAHTIHPLAGQGLNLGLADARSLAECVADGSKAGADVGSTLALEPYSMQRYAANHAMLGVCDKLHKVYSWSSGPVVWARDAGVNVLENWGWLKGKVMQAARG